MAFIHSNGTALFARASRRSCCRALKEGEDELTHDEVVMFEVISSGLDREWWAGYRIELQNRFSQDELLVWAPKITKR